MFLVWLNDRERTVRNHIRSMCRDFQMLTGRSIEAVIRTNATKCFLGEKMYRYNDINLVEDVRKILSTAKKRADEDLLSDRERYTQYRRRHGFEVPGLILSPAELAEER